MVALHLLNINLWKVSHWHLNSKKKNKILQVLEQLTTKDKIITEQL